MTLVLLQVGGKLPPPLKIVPIPTLKEYILLLIAAYDVKKNAWPNAFEILGSAGFRNGPMIVRRTCLIQHQVF